jgi:hypothetical protein
MTFVPAGPVTAALATKRLPVRVTNNVEAKHHHYIFWHLAAILNRQVFAPSIEQSFVDVVFVRSVGDDLAGLDAKILVEFRKLN